MPRRRTLAAACFAPVAAAVGCSTPTSQDAPTTWSLVGAPYVDREPWDLDQAPLMLGAGDAHGELVEAQVLAYRERTGRDERFATAPDHDRPSR